MRCALLVLHVLGDAHLNVDRDVSLASAGDAMQADWPALSLSKHADVVEALERGRVMLHKDTFARSFNPSKTASRSVINHSNGTSPEHASCLAPSLLTPCAVFVWVLLYLSSIVQQLF